MQDLYLKFADQAEADSLLYTVHDAVLGEDGGVVSEAYTTQNYMNTDVLGIIYEEQADPDADPVPMEGWHVNIRLMPGEDPSPLLSYQVFPQLPRRVWA